MAGASFRGVECPACDRQIGLSWASRIVASSPLLAYVVWARLARPDEPVEIYGLCAAVFFAIFLWYEMPLKKLD